MNKTNTPNPNNSRLREIVLNSGLTQAEALEVFNRDIGPATYSLAAFKSYLVAPETQKFRNLRPELLAHAEKQFAKLKDQA